MNTKINQGLHELEWTRPLEQPERKHNRYVVSFPPSFLEKLSEKPSVDSFPKAPHAHWKDESRGAHSHQRAPRMLPTTRLVRQYATL